MVAAKALGTGDTVLVFASEGGGPTTGKDLVAYGVVHYGAGSEAGAGAALVKVACARDAESFQRLLVACENLAGAVPGVKVLVAGVNTGRVGAFEALRGAGYRASQQGVAMEKVSGADAGLALHEQDGFDRPGVFLCDDWR